MLSVGKCRGATKVCLAGSDGNTTNFRKLAATHLQQALMHDMVLEPFGWRKARVHTQTQNLFLSNRGLTQRYGLMEYELKSHIKSRDGPQL